MSFEAWMVQAESDLDAARLLSANGLHSQAIFLSAQAVEKGHKAILFASGVRYTDAELKHFGHDLAKIAGHIPLNLHAPTDAGIAGMITILDGRSKRSRYPSPAAPIRPPKRGPKATNGPGADDPVSPDQSVGHAVAPSHHFAESATSVADADRLLSWCRERVARAARGAAAMLPTAGS